MKKILWSLLLCVIVFMWNACEKDASTSDDSGSGDNDVEDGVSHEEAGDYSWDAASVYTITLNGTSVAANTDLVTIQGSVATITGAGAFSITGTLANGQIVVDAGKNDLVRLIFNGIDITNNTGSAILVEKSAKTIVDLASGTQNSLTDGSAYANADDDPNAALFSKSDLTIFGDGSLIVKGNYQDGIHSKDGLIIKSGAVTVSAVDDGISGKDYLIVHGGSLNVNSGGDGIKSDNDVNTSVGYILIDGGSFRITSAGDAISAQTTLNVSAGYFVIKTGGGSSSSVSGDASAKGVKGLSGVTLAADSCSINAADDAIHSNNSIEINGGVYSLASADDAIHADKSLTVNDGNIMVTKCYEGFESFVITIQSGTVSIVSTDDGFNATAGTRTESDDKSFVYIHGGTITLNATTGDPLDSNGSISMNSGTVIIHGPNSQPEVGIDYNGSFNISGGFLVASGTNSNMTQAPSNSSTQYSVRITYRSSQAAGALFHIQDAEGNDLVTFAPVRKYQSMVFSSPALIKGATYTIYKSGTSTGTVNNGLYAGGVYSPGTEAGNFTIGNSVTNLSNL